MLHPSVRKIGRIVVPRRASFRTYFFIFAFLLTVVAYLLLNTWDGEFDGSDTYHISRAQNFSFDYLTTCELPKKDPWEPSIQRFLDPNFEVPNTPDRKIVTALVNGSVVVLTSDYKPDQCFGRCIWQTGEWDTAMDPWEPISTFRPKCDVVIVRCGRNPFNYYEAVHSQIVEIKDKPDYGTHKPTDHIPDPPKETYKSSVYIYVLDSVSASHATRAMPETLNVVRDSFDAVEFNYNNKVAMNSRPNAFAFLLGTQLLDHGWSVYGPARKSTGVPCQTPLDDQPFIGFKFRDMGYHTLFADEWGGGPLQYTDCRGFNRTWTKHSFKPYFQHMASKYTMGEMAFRRLHHLRHDFHLHIDQFLKAYKNESQCAIIWESLVDNSFLIFMADHGHRMGKIRQTPVGEMEDNNPFLIISIPRKFRNPAILERLKTNAQKLTTHYDVHATLIHIAEMIETEDYSPLFSPLTTPYQVEFGSSLFAPLPEPRHCGTLNIPFEWCLCTREYEPPIDPLSPTAVVLADTALSDPHAIIHAENVQSLCRRMTVIHEKTIAKRLILDREGELYDLKITVEPSGAIFQASYLVRRDNGITASLLSQSFQRLNLYGFQSYCVEKNEVAKPICYCRGYDSFANWRKYFDKYILEIKS